MMKKLAKFCAVSVIALTVSTAAFAAGDDNSLTLLDAVSKGVLKNPEYGVVANNKEATREELNQAKALWLPSIDLNADTGWEGTDTPAVSPRQSLYRNRASLSLAQLLFDGFGTQSEIERQKYRVESASNRVGEVAEFTGLDAVQAYLEVLRQRDLLAISRANVDDHVKILDTISTGARAGTVTKGDVSQADARLAQARATVASTEQDLRTAEALFIQKVGEMPGDMAFPDIPRDKLPASVDDAVREAVVNSPTLAVFESDIKVAMAEYKGSGSTLYPKVDVEANANTGDNVGGLRGNANGQSVLGVLKWNLYRGGADLDRQHEFLYRHAQAKERRAQAARQVEKDMRDTWAGMQASADRAQQFLDQANANEKVVSVYLDQFSLDRRTLLDVLDAQNELFVSRSSHISALYTEMFAIFRVLALEGKMLSTIGVPKPREARAEN
jgi:adhesin transport system outer membrane protein